MIEPLYGSVADFAIIIIKNVFPPVVKGSVEGLKLRYLAFFNKFLEVINKSCGIFLGIDLEEHAEFFLQGKAFTELWVFITYFKKLVNLVSLKVFKVFKQCPTDAEYLLFIVFFLPDFILNVLSCIIYLVMKQL